MTRPRVLLADDHVLLLEAFERLLESDYEIVGKVADGRALVERAIALVPDAIVTDITMPELAGLEAARQILARLPQVRIVFLTVHEDAALAAEALRAGAAGYLLKRSAAGELKRALVDVLSGKTYLTPLVAEGNPVSLAAREQEPSPLERLTPREREVLQLLAEGHGMKQVARRLGITARTVAFHKYRAMQTLQLKSNADLVQFAVKQRLV